MVAKMWIRKLRRDKILASFALALIMGATLVLIDDELSPDLYFFHWGPLDNISCHYINDQNALPSADWVGFQPPPRSIFFHETSCRGNLNSRQACAVESASRAHPDWQINVIFSASVLQQSLKSKTLAALRELNNVKMARVHIVDYSKGTPLFSMIEDGKLNRTRWRISHASDVLRYLSLYKFGGIYLDLDVVVAKSLGSLARNWAARESDVSVAVGALAFSKDEVGRHFAGEAIRDLKKRFRGDIWGHNGPGVITRVLQKLCSTPNLDSMSASTCDGFEVYGPQFFYPIRWQDAKQYFVPGELVADPYIYHVWNQITKDMKVHRDSPYGKLARRFCPTIYNIFGNDF